MHARRARHLDRPPRAARSGRRARRAARTAAGRAAREPKNSGASLWSAGPGVSMSRSRSTGLRKRAHAGSIPAPSAGSSPIDAVGCRRSSAPDAPGRSVKRRGSALAAGASSDRASRRRGGRASSRRARASGHSCSSRQRPPWSSLPCAVLRPEPPPITKIRTGASPSGCPVASSGSQRSKKSRAAPRSSARRPRRCPGRSRRRAVGRVAAHRRRGSTAR